MKRHGKNTEAQMFTPRLCTDVPGAALSVPLMVLGSPLAQGKQTERWETRPATGSTAAHAWPWPHQCARLAAPPGIFCDAVEQLGASRSVRRESLLLSVPATSDSRWDLHFSKPPLHKDLP